MHDVIHLRANRSELGVRSQELEDERTEEPPYARRLRPILEVDAELDAPLEPSLSWGDWVLIAVAATLIVGAFSWALDAGPFA